MRIIEHGPNKLLHTEKLLATLTNFPVSKALKGKI